MYLSFYPIGTSGHRASALVGFVPYTNYATPIYGHPGNYPLVSMPPAILPPQYMQPPPVYNPMNQAPPAQNSGASAAASGGISAVLEYDPPAMAAFMCWCSFGMLGQNRNPTKEFEASIVSILHATRLPKSTILIALEYINQRYANSAYQSLPELDIFVKMVVSLVLANKFNDDNTFTNKSWCGASGVKIDVLNALEREWLTAVNWNLSVVNFQDNIETLQECWTSWLQKQAPSPYIYSPPSGTVAADNYGTFSSVPSSPVYESASASSMYGYSSPINASPAKFTQDWSAPGMQNFHYAPYPQLQSIWAYPPTNYQSMPPRMDSAYSGLANPYYSCLATY